MKPLVALLILAAATTACSVFSGRGEDAPPDEAALVGCGEDDGSAPRDLRCTGLYDDVAAKRLAPGVAPYAPAARLWSDGAEKSRFVRLPDGRAIDASDPDEWTFPVGTKAWKEFAVHGRRVETRYFAKVRADKWVRATYVWSADGASATREDNGVTVDVDGSPYDVPSTEQCDTCHKGRKDALLGFDAIGLGSAGAEGITLAQLADEGRIAPAPRAEAVRLPEGTSTTEQKALAWMHVNCGVSCHNRSPDGEALGSGLFLRLDVAQLAAAKDLASLDPIATTLGRAAKTPKWAGATRVVPGKPDASLLVHLVETRARGEQMPPIATNVVDADGARAVRDWVLSLGRPTVSARRRRRAVPGRVRSSGRAR